MTRRHFAATAVLVLALAGCTDTVDGSGQTTRSKTANPPAATGARFADPGAARAVQSAVRAGVVAINTYDYRSLSKLADVAVRYTTATLRTQYLNTVRTIISTQAVKLKAVQQAQVDAVGLGPVSATTAAAVVVGRLRVRSTSTGGKTRIDLFRLTVDLQKVGGRWLLSEVTQDGTLPDAASGSADLRAASVAGRTCVVSFLSFRRASFAADFARALACATGSVRTDLADRRAATERTLRSGGFDLSATVRAFGIERAAGTRVVAVATVDGSRSTAPSAPTRQALRVTLVRSAATWRISGLESLGT